MDAEKIVEEIEKRKENLGLYIGGINTVSVHEFNKGLDTAIGIIKFHQDDKVVWPKYVADDWEEIQRCGSVLNNNVSMMISGAATSMKTANWLMSDKHVKAFLQGVLYGYTVEKEKKYRVRIPGFYYVTVPQFLTLNTFEGKNMILKNIIKEAE